MPAYLPDKAETVRRLAELKTSLDFAEYELAAGIALARALGLSWSEVGQALGFAEGATKQGASQWAKRRNVDAVGLVGAERERIGKLIGVGERVSRFAVREIASGKVGVSKVTRRTLSTHLSREVAEERARKRGATAEVWQLDPDGTETQLVVRPRSVTEAHRKLRQHRAEHDDFFA